MTSSETPNEVKRFFFLLKTGNSLEYTPTDKISFNPSTFSFVLVEIVYEGCARLAELE